MADPQPTAAPSSPPPAPAAPPKNKRALVIIAIIALTVIGLGLRMWWRSHNFVETDNAFITSPVHPVSARIPGTVTKVLVKENQIVREGDLLAELDPMDQRLKIEQIQAQIVAAQQQLLQSDAQIAQTQAQASAASAQVLQSNALLQRARQDAERFSSLYTSDMKAVSKAEVDVANTNLSGANADLQARKDAQLAATAQTAASKAARDVLKSQITVLQVQLKDAQQQLAYNRILAPSNGKIGKKTLEVGARVQPGQQLMAIVETDAWVVANFKETQLGELRVGHTATITVDAMPNHPLEARIDSFAPASGAQFALLPPDNATGNFTKVVQRFPVKIVFRPEDLKQLGERLVPGMSVAVEVKKNQASK